MPQKSPRRRKVTSLLYAAVLWLCAPGLTRADGLLSPCTHCELMLGVGTTYYDFGWTHALVIPLTLELDDRRWELGAFRFATEQHVAGAVLPSGTAAAADPYWGFTAMRRWQVLHRSWGRFYLGVGANYRSETDYFEVTHWNFAYLVAARFDIGPGTGLEFGIRHWSNAWIRRPNRGQDLITVSCTL
jgi:Lipid A 3-O-deacylase (PagL)